MESGLDQARFTHANLLVVEIGNSHVSIATVLGASVRTNHRFGLDELDDMTEMAERSWEAFPQDEERCVAIGSVVPPTLTRVRERLADVLDTPLRAVGEELHRPMSLAVEAPERVGVDRVCSAAAAYEAIRKACVIASFGTAITVDCVNDEGVFMGGAILPGLAMQARGLYEGTDALPQVEVGPTDVVFGATTEQAIRNGIVYGSVGALREITERYATALNAWPQLVVTGGNSELIREHCDFIDNVVPDLCIRGIALAHRKHFQPLEVE